MKICKNKVINYNKIVMKNKKIAKITHKKYKQLTNYKKNSKIIKHMKKPYKNKYNSFNKNNKII